MALVATLGFCVVDAMPAFGQEEAEMTQEHGTEAHEAEWFLNHLSLTFGGVSALDQDETDFTTGMEYERRLSRWIGLGVLYEFVFGQQKREMVFGLPLSVHAVGGLRLVAAPLAELVEKRELEEKEFEGGVRFGAYYVDESL